MREYSKSSSLEIATTSHVIYAFDTLVSHLSQTSVAPSPEFPDAETALFVTWKRSPQQDGEHAKLRGCIGILEPRNLHLSLRDYTLTSALRDARFPPIQMDEVIHQLLTLADCLISRALEYLQYLHHSLNGLFKLAHYRCVH
jgi:AMMECR1 domain-containing protein